MRVVHRFTESGGAAVLITHKLDEALQVADRITVLRQGETILTGLASSLSQGSLAEAMLGQTASGVSPNARRPAGSGTSLIRVQALEVPRESGYGMETVRHPEQ